VYNYIGLGLNFEIRGNGIRWNETKHVELEQFLHAFTSRGFWQRQLGFLVYTMTVISDSHNLKFKIEASLQNSFNMATVVCGFCRRGTEATVVCGKLWHDADKNCTAHQRCMVEFSCMNICQLRLRI